MMGDIRKKATVYALVASPNCIQDGICFVARSDGLYRSEDGGQSWQYAFANLHLNEPMPTTSVAVGPDFPSDKSVFCGVRGGILHSADGGSSWRPSLLPAPPPIISALIVSPNYAQDGMVLAGTLEDGVFVSCDRGESWQGWNFGLMDMRVLALAISPSFSDDETVFAGTESGVFCSTNGGRAWRETSFSDEWAPVLSLAVSPSFVHDGRLWAGTEKHGLFESQDGGRTWQRLAATQLTQAINGIILSDRFPEPAWVMVVQPFQLMISRDAGQTWIPWQTGSMLEQPLVCAVAPWGLVEHAPLLVGLSNGDVRRI